MVDFAVEIGVHPNSYSKYELGKTLPNAATLEHICRMGINVNWLLTGEGPMYLGEGGADTAGRPGVRPRAGEYLFVPLLEGSVTGGPDGAVLFDEPEDMYPFKRCWIEDRIGKAGIDRGRLILVRVRGDSMSPTINPGELVLVDLWEEERLRVRNGRIYLVAMPDGLVTVKRITLGRDEDGQARLVCLSDSPQYRPFEIPVGPGHSILRHVLGRIRWVGRELD